MQSACQNAMELISGLSRSIESDEMRSSARLARLSARLVQAFAGRRNSFAARGRLHYTCGVLWRALNSFLIAGLLLLALLGGPSMVLCVAPGGHVRIEASAASGQSCCGHDAADHESEPAPSDCGDCVDIALQLDNSRAQELSFTLAPLPVVFTRALPVRDVADFRPGLTPRRLHPPPLLASLSAIRLQV